MRLATGKAKTLITLAETAYNSCSHLNRLLRAHVGYMLSSAVVVILIDASKLTMEMFLIVTVFKMVKCAIILVNFHGSTTNRMEKNTCLYMSLKVVVPVINASEMP